LPNQLKVIRFDQLASKANGTSIKWRFFDYGADIESWYSLLSEDEQETLEDLLKWNSKVDLPTDWLGCKMLRGEAKTERIWEWRFHPAGTQQRLLGTFGANRKEAIFLIGCNHKQNVYQPANCLNTAVKRAREVREGKVKLNERQVRTDL
jgi:hypothetical protein